MAIVGPSRLLFLKVCVVIFIFCALLIFLHTDEAERRHIGTGVRGTLPFLNRTSLRKGSSLFESFTIGKNQLLKQSNESVINILFIFTRAYEVKFLEQKFSRCLRSLFKTSSKHLLHLHIITDSRSLALAKQLVRFVAYRSDVKKLQVDLHNVEKIVEPLRETVSFLQPHFSYKPGAYYSDALFFLSVAIHRVFPQDRIVMIDIDTKFVEDVAILYKHFDNFGPHAIIGLAHEQQPVYYHLLREYRLKHPNTTAGGIPKNGGNPGFNSGVILLRLDRMRNSVRYNTCVQAEAVDDLARFYQFKGHLGDQDFFTLLSFRHPELFYLLPCSWNRQLCQWWKTHGYSEVFEQYYKCQENVSLYHGNCNSPMPEEKGVLTK